jgi:hypothetical protein
VDWFVSERGETVGPWPEADVLTAIERGRFTIGAVVRDNAGGQWTPIGSSPFAYRFALAANRTWWIRWAVVFVTLSAAFIALVRLFIGVAAGDYTGSP